MEKRQVTRFYAVCEKEYRSASAARNHEKACKCFTNPKFRACNTCKYNNGIVKDGDGYQSWAYVDCIHPASREINFDKFKIPNSTIGSCVNCPSWENDTYKGGFEKRTFNPKSIPPLIVSDTRKIQEIYYFLRALIEKQKDVPEFVTEFIKDLNPLPF